MDPYNRRDCNYSWRDGRVHTDTLTWAGFWFFGFILFIVICCTVACGNKAADPSNVVVANNNYAALDEIKREIDSIARLNLTRATKARLIEVSAKLETLKTQNQPAVPQEAPQAAEKSGPGICLCIILVIFLIWFGIGLIPGWCAYSGREDFYGVGCYYNRGNRDCRDSNNDCE